MTHMPSALIGKIEKAHRYAEQRDRMRFHDFAVTFAGDNDTHEVAYHEGSWRCACEFFESWGRCSHTMALERVLTGMIPAELDAAL